MLPTPVELDTISLHRPSSISINTQRKSTLSDEQEDIFVSLLYDIRMHADETILDVADEDLTALTISSREDIGNVRITMSSYGPSCPIVSTRNLCDQTFSASFNPATDPQTLDISFADTAAGTTTLVMDVCQDDICVQHDLSLYRSAGDVQSLVFTTVTDTAPAGTLLPFRIQAVDAYANTVDLLDIPYTLSLDKGTFLGKD